MSFRKRGKSKVRQRVLAVLFGTPDRSLYANEVIALAQSGSGAVQRELAALSGADVLTVTRLGNRVLQQPHIWLIGNEGHGQFSQNVVFKS